MQGTAYSRTFTRGGIALVVPGEPDLTWVHDRYMNELAKGDFRPETRAGLLDVIDGLRRRHGIDGVILGGTELPLILRDVDDIGIPLLDTGRIHVDAALAAMLA
jgi:aspartate racemase